MLREFRVSANLKGNVTTIPFKALTEFGAVAKGLDIADRNATADPRFMDGELLIQNEANEPLFTSDCDGEIVHILESKADVINNQIVNDPEPPKEELNEVIGDGTGSIPPATNELAR